MTALETAFNESSETSQAARFDIRAAVSSDHDLYTMSDDSELNTSIIVY